MPSRDDLLAAHFLRAAGIAAVAIGRDLTVRVIEVAPIKRPAGAAMFCCKRGREGRLAAALRATGGTTQAVMRDQLRRIAAAQRATVTDHDVLVSRARAYVDRINFEIDRMQRSGDLAGFNREFKEARKADPNLRYADALQARKAAMIEAVALQLGR